MTFFLHLTLEKDSSFVARKDALQIRLADDSRYFWLMIIPETAATELHDLDEDMAASLWAIARHLGGALKTHCNATKINTAVIGNIVPQLHVHIVARHDDDATWPLPIWGQGVMQPLNEAAKAARLSAIQGWLGKM